MKGVIIYADDDVLNHESGEYKLFQKFSENCEYSIIPINKIQDLESTILSISTFRALLLDWSFKIESMDPDIPTKHENPLNFLKTQKIYSIICIYSREEISEGIKKELIEIYGENKISFQLKTSNFNENEEFKKISELISTIEGSNPHMEIPFIWSQAINQSVQSIFRELEFADPHWIQEIKETSLDGNEPISEVIGIFNNLLYETIYQNKILRDKLEHYKVSEESKSDDKTAKLYRRIFYTIISEDSPLMTGDIFKFDDNSYGILITPECDMLKKDKYEFLMIFKDKSHGFQEKYKKEFKKDMNIKNIFNNGVLSRHILVSFPFDVSNYNTLGLIEFDTALNLFSLEDEKGNNIKNARILFKLNTPYIQQIRQRYVAFFGRFGVPKIPDSLSIFNLK